MVRGAPGSTLPDPVQAKHGEYAVCWQAIMMKHVSNGQSLEIRAAVHGQLTDQGTAENPGTRRFEQIKVQAEPQQGRGPPDQ